MGRKFTYQEVKNYIEKFDYELISNEYINASVHLEIKCNKDHVYKASFDRFRQGRRCPVCRANEKGDRSRKYTTEDVKQLFQEHGFRIELDKYIEEKEHFKVICSHGHEFHTSFRCFRNAINRNKNICRECRNQEYLNELKDILSPIGYKILSDKYVNSNTKLLVECDKNHSYEVTPDNIKRGNKCPVCNISKGEKAIEDFLNNHNIIFKRQKVYKQCRYKWVLRFDFFIPELNLLIEYDGIQHFEPIEFFGNEKGLAIIQKRDQIKNEYCNKNNIPLMRIPYYNIDKISDILTENVLNPLINQEKTSTTKSS